MSFYGFGEMFEGYSEVCIHVRRNIFAHTDVWLSEGYSMRRPGSEDPHLCEHKFSYCHIKKLLGHSVLMQWIKPVYALYSD